jgi:hypothetical protein
MKSIAVFAIALAYSILGAAEDTIPPDAGNGRPIPVELSGVIVTPHVRASSLQYENAPSAELGARVELYLLNTAPVDSGTNGQVTFNAVLFDGREPQRMILEGDWAWHDTPNSWPEADLTLPPGALTVWSFNTKSSQWGVGRQFPLTITDWQRLGRADIPVSLAPQGVWLSSVVFTSSDNNSLPDTILCHISNQTAIPVTIGGGRLFLSKTNTQNRILWPQAPFSQIYTWPTNGVIPAGEKGILRVKTGRLPLSLAAMQITMADPQGRRFTLWSRPRIKRETFDIGGGWVQNAPAGVNSLAHEPFLKLLKRMHINTAHFTNAPGYTDQTGPEGLYTRYPLKRFGKLEPGSVFETDAQLPFVHAVEFLGEPQSARNAVPLYPQAVFQALEPYAKTRFTTTVTLSDESDWRYYAGLSDNPNFDAYRVCAPAADDLRSYRRWPEKSIEWGAPLETLGDLTRCLRELSRPIPIAAWSQGPHNDWEVLGGRKRATPTPDEIRMQAYHALSSRITSLYWFNISLPALAKYRDTIDELTRIGREIRMLDEFYIEGDAGSYQQIRRDGRLDWDLASIVAPQGALLFALDLDYEPNLSQKVFEFHRRNATFRFDLPSWLNAADVFRVDSEGVYDVEHKISGRSLEITDKQSRAAIYVAAPDAALRGRLEQKRAKLAAGEAALDFDPAGRGRDFDLLIAPLRGK